MMFLNVKQQPLLDLLATIFMTFSGGEMAGAGTRGKTNQLHPSEIFLPAFVARLLQIHQ